MQQIEQIKHPLIERSGSEKLRSMYRAVQYLVKHELG